MRVAVFFPLLLVACSAGPSKDTGDTGPGETGIPLVDADGDGVSEETDCDDTDATVYPGAEELCDGRDNDCDRDIDEGLETSPWYADADGDGWGDDADVVDACVQLDGRVAVGGDCRDDDSAYHPGAAEDCADPNDYNCDDSVAYADADGDGWAACVECDDLDPDVNPAAEEACNGVDDDCDGEIDEADSIDATVWYLDVDQDGWGSSDDTVTACDQPEGYTARDGDCDDADERFHPGADESDCADPNDYNCDGSVGYDDADSDGVPACEDCDDARAETFPGADERCNGYDDDCDGETDEDSAVDAAIWYGDGDGDGYAGGATTTVACEAPDGFYATVDDCDDTDADVYPGATEVCNGVDDDCDGATDDPTAADAVEWYGDGDGDGYGDDGTVATACDAPDGYVAGGGDCDDSDPGVNPGEDEQCNGVDDDCDGDVDEPSAIDASTWYGDDDGDGYGDPSVQDVACSPASGFVGNDGDCDDTDGDVHPGAEEVCNGTDDDCDGSVDPATSADASTWYRDADGDSYGTPDSTTTACAAPTGYVGNDDDCLDTNGTVNPAGVEVCNDLDDDCDGVTDPATATDAATWYADADADGYGDPAVTTAACDAPSGYVSDDQDCEPADPAVNPGADELCNGVDDDCDGVVDPDTALDASTWYLDGDGDGYGLDGDVVVACDLPSGYSERGGDCADGDAATNPGATEICDDGIDNDCDGTSNGCEVTGSVTPADADAMWSGDDRYEGLGNAAVGGALGSGATPYLAVAASGWDGSDSSGLAYGRVLVWEGPITGAEALGDAVTVIYGLDSDGQLGGSLAYAPDVDGDGYGELLVGSPGQDGSTANGGAVFRFSGPTGGVLTTSDADAGWYGAATTDAFGYALAYADDIDGDGVSDMVAGAPDANDGSTANAGFAGLYTLDEAGSAGAGDAWASAWGEAANDGFGFAVASGVDVDGDGVADVIVGAPETGSSDGSVYLFLGGFASVDQDAGTSDGAVDGSSDGTLGAALALLEDSDGDGYGDVAVGSPGEAGGGKVYLWMGGSAGPWSGRTTPSSSDATIGAAVTHDLAGTTVASAGDPDNDGDTDLLIGAPDADPGSVSNAGAAYLLYAPFSGTTSLTSYGARVAGDSSNDSFGVFVGGLGDIDGDAIDDWAVGSVEDDAGGTSTGALVVMFGAGL